MATSVVVVSGTLPTSGTVALTSSGFGTPDCAILFASEANATNPANHAIMAFGFVVGATQRGSSYRSQNGVSATNTARMQTNSYALTVISATADSTLIEYSASLITDGVQISIGSGSSAVGRSFSAMLFKGVVNKAAGNVALNGATNVAVSCGFRPTVVFVLHGGQSSIPATSAALMHSFGAVCWDSSDVRTQICLAQAATDNTAVSKVNNSLWTTGCGRLYFDDGASGVNRTVTANSPTSAGFNFVCDAASTQQVLYLAIELADHNKVWLGTKTCSTGVSTQAVTGIGFKPQAVVAMSNRSTLLDSTSNAPAGALMYGLASGASNEAVFTASIADASSTSTDKSYFDGSAFLDLRSAAGTQDGAGSLSSFDSDGLTISWGTQPTSAWQLGLIAIGTDAAAYTHPTLSAATLVPAGGNNYQPRVTYTF